MSNVYRQTEEWLAARIGTAAPKKPMVPVPKVSAIEQRLSQQIEAHGLPVPVRNYFHIKGRDFTLDFAWPARKLGVEVQGMAHRIKGKFRADMEKRALAMLDGWRVLEVGGHEVRHEIAIGWLTKLLEMKP